MSENAADQPPNPSRRTFLKILTAGALAALGLANKERVGEALYQMSLSKDQIKAIAMLNSGSPQELAGKIVHNRRIRLDLKEEARKRTTPHSKLLEGANELKDKLQPGDLIPEALIFEGNNPETGNPQDRSDWLFVPERDSAGKVVDGYFTWMGSTEEVPQSNPSPTP